MKRACVYCGMFEDEDDILVPKAMNREASNRVAKANRASHGI